MQQPILKTEKTDGIVMVTISRPEALNALNSEFFKEAGLLIKSLQKENSIRALVITGEGKAFAAGADISEMAGMSPEEAMAFSKKGQDIFTALENLPFPVIAAINGYALGGGLELAMACDFRIASTRARLGLPEVNLGVIPGYGGTQRLARHIGLANALYLLMTAENIEAQEAFRLGLVQKLTEPETLLEETLRIARQIAFKGPLALQKVKKVTRQGLELNLEDGCRLENKEFGPLFGMGSQGEEGMKAFLEKRKPQWT